MRYEIQALHSYKNVAWNEDRIQIYACRILGDNMKVSVSEYLGYRIFVFKYMYAEYVCRILGDDMRMSVSEYLGYRISVS